ncbi:hypothetical protein [Arthrobacter sp. NyZ413]|uniref:hypothetical protein n=1 Tax=Arthrobacter sp. NyZ413 TaxID=3144669 RepID=UPI003BF814CC
MSEVEEFLEDAQTLVHERTIVVPNPEFVVRAGGHQARGYVTSIEIWNKMTRVLIAFPATPIPSDEFQAFRLVDSLGNMHEHPGGSSTSNGLYSFHDYRFGQVAPEAEFVDLLYSVVPLTDGPEDDELFQTLARIPLS